MPTPRDRDHEIDPDEFGKTASWSVAVDHLEEARRQIQQAADEVLVGG